MPQKIMDMGVRWKRREEIEKQNDWEKKCEFDLGLCARKHEQQSGKIPEDEYTSSA